MNRNLWKMESFVLRRRRKISVCHFLDLLCELQGWKRGSHFWKPSLWIPAKALSRGSTLQAEGEMWSVVSLLGTLQRCSKVLQEGGSVLGELHWDLRLIPISPQTLTEFERSPSGSPCLSFCLQRCPKDNRVNELLKGNMDKDQLRNESEAPPQLCVLVELQNTNVSLN